MRAELATARPAASPYLSSQRADGLSPICGVINNVKLSQTCWKNTEKQVDYRRIRAEPPPTHTSPSIRVSPTPHTFKSTKI